MSGRKSSEVAAVLEQAAKNRAASEANYKNSVDRCLQHMASVAGNIENCLAEIGTAKVVLSQEAGRELPDEFELISKELSALIGQARCNIDVRRQTQKYRTLDKEFDARLQNLDYRANMVRSAINAKHNGWYCDTEYAQAQQIKADMVALGCDKQRMLRDLEVIDRQVADESIRLQSVLQRKMTLEKRITALNRRASEIIELRKQAGKAKDTVASDFANIDKTLAKKFMADEFNSLQAEVSKFAVASDRDVLQNMQTLLGRIASFAVKLEAVYNVWQAAKKKAEKHLATVEDMAVEDKFYHPNQYLKDRQTAQAISMFAFLEEYADDSYEKSYATMMSEARQCLDAEQFDACCQKLAETEELLRRARAYANSCQSKLIGSYQLALDTRDIMRAHGFKVTSSFVNGKDARDGFAVKCTMGDEIIDFTKVDVSEDGSVTMEIDHTEGASTCSGSWKNLTGAFNKAGIPITDIKKNGNSVLYRQAQGSRDAQNTRVRQR